MCPQHQFTNRIPHSHPPTRWHAACYKVASNNLGRRPVYLHNMPHSGTDGDIAASTSVLPTFIFAQAAYTFFLSEQHLNPLIEQFVNPLE